ncbi:GNAT family N-acetyltransferase [Oscillospiraceae bacterium MB08-C2-2]|nr:GNAT family N-acetyltransferase [Oscillospiraceae bacterium MB08-C2-2]
MGYTIEHKLPTPHQWMKLRASVGWAAFEDEVTQKSLAATNFCVCAFDGDELIGMARVLGDDVICFYIGNVMVSPHRQGEGIGKAIMDEIIAYVDAHAVPGAIASLLAIRGKEDFYLPFGFKKRPDDTHGCGMSKYY